VDLKQMLGARIKEIRSKKKITQEQLAERMGINKIHKIFLYFLYPEHPVNHVRKRISYAVTSI
jgi:transcriptional regulator with XRE-family HTH domain